MGGFYKYEYHNLIVPLSVRLGKNDKNTVVCLNVPVQNLGKPWLFFS